MALTTLLVHVEDESAPDPRLSLAVDLANRFGAKLIGVGAELYRSSHFAAGGLGYGTVELVADEMALVHGRLKGAEEKFRGLAAQIKAGSEWRSAVEFPLNQIVGESRAADLVITSRKQRNGHSVYEVAAPGLLVLQTGRPVLVATPEASALEARRVLVAWKDSREARRAVSDAMPFLKSAEMVEVVEIVDGKGEKPAAAARLADVTEYLQRHGVSASASVDIEDKHATGADQLLDFAERTSADLIVAGGYGHSRFQEWVFGGFTKALLAQTSRAVLFSH